MSHTVPFLPSRKTSYPVGNYTPYGYLHTPSHTGLNPTGILRSVPPLGFGIFTRGLPWYGMENMKAVNNYICMLRPAFSIDGLLLGEREDFDRAGITLCSRYHSGNVMSYDFSAKSLDFSLAWYRIWDDVLGLRLFIHNDTGEKRELSFTASQLYGMNGRSWWGSDAATIRYVKEESALVAKILAYGDVFSVMGDCPPVRGVSAYDEASLRAWQEGKTELDGGYKSCHLPQSISGALDWKLAVPSQGDLVLNLVLARGVNEKTSLVSAKEALKNSEGVLNERLAADDRFYRDAPLLEGDWPETWKNGWVYDFETIRMNLMAPRGIYRHTWDAMQVMFPRTVLGETAIDMATLSYADIETALEVMEGMFEDAPDVFIPCSREDGSVNMIGEDGSECGTAPIWGMPIRAIRILLARSGDLLWLKRLYPRLKNYIEWWRDNRRDSDGWFHCNNSWESGQDGSSRFVSDEDNKNGPKMAANAEHVRTADLEAAMASAVEDMAFFAGLLGCGDDKDYYLELAREGRKRTESMFVVKCFRDFDARTGKPFLVENRYDMMLTMPVSLGMATEEQKKAMDWLFKQYDAEIERIFLENPPPKDIGYAPYWPPILQTLVEAVHQTGDLEMASRIAARMIDPAYRRNDSRIHWPGRELPGIPSRHAMFIPGNGRENLSAHIEVSGCENYGWGCLSPMLILENIIGLRPLDALGRSFVITPVLPEDTSLLPGKDFSVRNLSHGPFRFDLFLARESGGTRVKIQFRSCPDKEVFFSTGTKWEETRAVDVLLAPQTGLTIRETLPEFT
ncbi:hypothetical protein FACS1894147_09080 [Spirochaetia bacterium]|nr:hypothetical protein FACS1894147_09080 [Spirochaetia bacterium]